MIDFIKQRYQIRQCRTLKPRTRPCLNYHIKRCLAPCMGYVTKEEYHKQIDEIIELLEGKTEKIIKDLEQKMEEASKKLEFEKSSRIKRQKTSNRKSFIKTKSIKYFRKQHRCYRAIQIRTRSMYRSIFCTRKQNDRKRALLFNELKDMEDKEILSGFIKQYYMDNPNIPNKIMLREELEDKEVIEQWLSNELGKKVELKSPKKEKN